MITVTIPGASACTAQQKGVSVIGRRAIFYTKAKVKAEAERMAKALRKVAPKKPLEGPLLVAVRIVFPFNKDEAKKFVAHLADDQFTVLTDKGADFDNVLKLLLDTCNAPNPKKRKQVRVGLWQDDRQIALCLTEKLRGCAPRIDLTVHSLAHNNLARWTGHSLQRELNALESHWHGGLAADAGDDYFAQEFGRIIGTEVITKKRRVA